MFNTKMVDENSKCQSYDSKSKYEHLGLPWELSSELNQRRLVHSNVSLVTWQER